AGITERKDALLGAALFLVAARAAECGIETVFVERLFQRHGLHDLGMDRRAVRERADALRDAFLVDVHDQLEAQSLRSLVAELDHLAEFPRRIDMEQRERRL